MKTFSVCLFRSRWRWMKLCRRAADATATASAAQQPDSVCVLMRSSVCKVCAQASVKRSHSPPRISKQDASFTREVCECALSDSNERGVCFSVFGVCVLAARRKSPVQQLSKRPNPPPHTCREHYSSSITFNHSIPPSFSSSS